MYPSQKQRDAKKREQNLRLRLLARDSTVKKYVVVVIIIGLFLIAIQFSGRLVASRVLPTFTDGANTWSVICTYRHLPFNTLVDHRFDRVEAAKAFQCPPRAEG